MSTPPLPPSGGWLGPLPADGIPAGNEPTSPPGDFGSAVPSAPQPWPAPASYGPGAPGAYPPGGYPPAYPNTYPPTYPTTYPMLPAPPKRPPGKFWYGIGAALIALALAVGLIGGVGGFVRIHGKQPQDDATFASRGSTTVRLEPGTKRVLYISGDEAAGEHTVNCIAAGATNGRVSLKRYDGKLTLNGWHAMFTLEATQAGDYSISCAGNPSDTFGVGGYVGPGGFFFSIVSIVAGLGLGLAGIITLIVTGALRSRRLPAAPAPYPGPPYPGSPYPGPPPPGQ